MKKKILTFIYFLAILFLIYIVQLFVIDSKTLFGVKPNLILILCIVFCVWYGLYKGTIFSFIIGLLTDFIFGASGIFTICYTVTALAVGLINNNYRKENRMSLVYITIIATTTFEVVEYISYAIMSQVYSNLFYLLKQIILSSILNIVIVYIIYTLIYNVTQYFDDRINGGNINSF